MITSTHQNITLSLPASLIEELKRTASKRAMSKLVALAIANELKRRKRLELTDKLFLLRNKGKLYADKSVVEDLREDRRTH